MFGRPEIARIHRWRLIRSAQLPSFSIWLTIALRLRQHLRSATLRALVSAVEIPKPTATAERLPAAHVSRGLGITRHFNLAPRSHAPHVNRVDESTRLLRDARQPLV